MNKLSNFQSFVYSNPFEIYCITETWLSNFVYDNEIIPSKFPNLIFNVKIENLVAVEYWLRLMNLFNHPLFLLLMTLKLFHTEKQ